MKKNREVTTFSDIMRGLQHSVSVVNEIINNQYIRTLNDYLDSDGNLKKITIPVADNKSVTLPLISLLPQKPILVDEVELCFKAHLDVDDIKQFNNHNRNEVDRASFSVDLKNQRRGSSKVDVKIKYRVGDEPEGYARLLDDINKNIGAEGTM